MRGWLIAAVALASLSFLSPYGVIRTLLALGMGLLILAFGVKYVHSVIAAPPEPELADVSDYGLRYVCTMCGLELKVEVAAKDRAPTHCMEPMVLVRTGGKPPLRPV